MCLVLVANTLMEFMDYILEYLNNRGVIWIIKNYIYLLRAQVHAHAWRSEDNLLELDFSSYHLCLRDWPQAINIIKS